MPPLPAPGRYLFDAYLRLRRRKGGGLTTQPVEWPDIAAFIAVTGQQLGAWEVGVIEALDDAYMTARAGFGDDFEGES